jgi:hypothetical protein
MLVRLRVLLIAAGLAALPVTADLHDGFVWSEASAQDNYSQPALPLYWLYPWCTLVKLNYYNNSGKYYGSNYGHDSVEGTRGQFNCARTACVRHDWCISEATNFTGQNDYTPTKITYGAFRKFALPSVRSVLLRFRSSRAASPPKTMSVEKSAPEGLIVRGGRRPVECESV